MSDFWAHWNTGLFLCTLVFMTGNGLLQTYCLINIITRDNYYYSLSFYVSLWPNVDNKSFPRRTHSIQ